MADQRTLDHYRDHLATYLDLYQSISVPRLEHLILSFFHEGGRTLDVGCASGRDLTTLLSHGFRAEGLDAVEGFVDACRARHPDTPVHHATLPDLSELLSDDQAPHFEERYDNLLVSAVLMHLPSTELQRALSQLKRLLREGGLALISVRASRATDTPTVRLAPSASAIAAESTAGARSVALPLISRE